MLNALAEKQISLDAAIMAGENITVVTVKMWQFFVSAEKLLQWVKKFFEFPPVRGETRRIILAMNI